MLSFFSSLPGAVAQGAIWGIMAVGVFITYKILDLADLTVDGSFGTGGAVLVVCTAGGMNIYLAMLLSLLAGCAAGFVTGVLHTKFGIPAILAGILTQIALYSVNLRIMSGKANQPLSAMKYRKILLVSLRNINKSLIVCGIFVVVIIALLYWFFGTELGHSLRATGCNQAMARANGINTATNKIIGFVVSNGLVALSGGLLAQYQGFADVNMGRGAIVIGLAAIIIGDVVFGKIFKNFALKLFGAVLGGVIYYIVISFVLWLGLPANDLKMLTAAVVQCSEPCCQETFDNESAIRQMIARQEDMKIPIELLPVCPHCGKPLTMNLRSDDTFVEDEGWHRATERYEKFLRTREGQKILFLELGVGYNTPVIIKYPFWQMTAKNPNAAYVCINQGQAVCPQEIERQSVCINADIGQVLQSLSDAAIE